MEKRRWMIRVKVSELSILSIWLLDLLDELFSKNQNNSFIVLFYFTQDWEICPSGMRLSKLYSILPKITARIKRKFTFVSSCIKFFKQYTDRIFENTSIFQKISYFVPYCLWTLKSILNVVKLCEEEKDEEQCVLLFGLMDWVFWGCSPLWCQVLYEPDSPVLTLPFRW